MNHKIDSESKPDSFEIKLQEKLIELRQCQEQKSLESCLKCEKILECELRDSYIVTVYESMNKGQGGGFEF